MSPLDDDSKHLNHESTFERSTARRSHLTKRQWDVGAAQRFLVSVLSTIFYARGSFPDDCFRTVPHWAVGWKLSHHNLLNSGKPLPPRARDNVLGKDGPLIYFRDSGNNRLRQVLNTLVGRIFPAVEHKRLGKILLCYSRSKTRDPDALIELYSLKFRYTDTGSMYIYVSCGGTPRSPISSCENPFMEFLRTRPPFDCDFYTHQYFYSIDGNDLDEKQSHGLREQVRSIVYKLQSQQETRTHRIGTLAYHSLPVKDSQGNETVLARAKAHHPEAIGRSMASELHQSDQVQTPCLNISTGSSEWLSPAWITETSRSKPLGEGDLSVFEEPSDELPPTQILTSQPIDGQRLFKGAGTLQPATSRRRLSSFVNENASSDGPEAECQPQHLPKRLKKNSASYGRSSPIDTHTQVCASPFVPPSSDMPGFRSTSPPSEFPPQDPGSM